MGVEAEALLDDDVDAVGEDAANSFFAYPVRIRIDKLKRAFKT
jgi:hypothetical protein